MRGSLYAAVAMATLATSYWGCFSSTGTPKSAAVCPSNLEPTFTSISTQILNTPSCGVDTTGCHSHEGSVTSGGLDFTIDPYHALLGADGKGAPAENISGDAGRPLRRVVPGDPQDSFIVIKLSTTTYNDPQYGSGMPFTSPGSVCPATLQTIEQWIDAGAPKN